MEQIDLRSRRARKMSQRELGILASLSQPHIARVEKGERHLSAEALLRVCRALHLTPSEAQQIAQLYLEPVPDPEPEPSRTELSDPAFWRGTATTTT